MAFGRFRGGGSRKGLGTREAKFPIFVGADPGFPVRGGVNPPGGANIRFCQNFQNSA